MADYFIFYHRQLLVFQFNLQTVKKKMSRYVHGAEKDFTALFSDTSFYPKFKDKQDYHRNGEGPGSKPYYLYTYKKDNSGRLVMQLWNTQYVLPDSGIISSSLKTGFAELPNGFYTWNKYDSSGIFAIALFPIKWNYIITNEYLKNKFVNDPSAGLQYDIFPGAAKKEAFVLFMEDHYFISFKKRNQLTLRTTLFQ
jgi:hypothetical protein